jgi:hypothetical protein
LQVFIFDICTWREYFLVRSILQNYFATRVADQGYLFPIPDLNFSFPDPGGSREKRLRIPDLDPHQRI